MRMVIIAFSTLMLFTGFAFADITLKIHKINATSFPLLKVYVSVEQDGLILNKLNSESFKVVIEGKRNVKVIGTQQFSESGETLAILIAVDSSGSMRGKTLAVIKEAIKSLVDKKGEDDELGLISFNDDVYQKVYFTSNPQEFKTKLEGLKAGGTITVLFKAVYESLELLGQKDLPENRYLVVLSDGKDEGEGFSLNDAIQKANENNVPVYSLGFASMAERKYLDNMVVLAKKTNGEYQEAQNNDDIVSAFSIVADRILRQHVLRLNADFKADGKEHQLGIVYTGVNGATDGESITFTAPMFNQIIKEKNDLQSLKRFFKFDKRRPDNILAYGIAIGIALIALIIIAWLVFRRKNILEPVEDTISSQLAPVANEENKHGEIDKPPITDFIDNLESTLVLSSPEYGINLPLSSGAISIGANPENMVVVDEETISGFHAEISGNGDEWMIKDLGSSNGTIVNDCAIQCPLYIKPGDVLKLGRVEIKVIENDK